MFPIWRGPYKKNLKIQSYDLVLFKIIDILLNKNPIQLWNKNNDDTQFIYITSPLQKMATDNFYICTRFFAM